MSVGEAGTSEWAPSAALAGDWEGNDGLDVSFHNARDRVGETGYLEKVQLKPFGPVENGRQSLYGLDYRMAAWRHGEEDQNPFHTEVGYWLWDARRRPDHALLRGPAGHPAHSRRHMRARRP
ncbi:MAG TPA: heme-binding beta-barrel domain-containing protein [Acidimicrobiales bacterium]|nr:heme-binding beta-barrel domain-containing protein [Acidimicrobiales bacterium]